LSRPRFQFEGLHHIWDDAEGCYWIRESDINSQLLNARNLLRNHRLQIPLSVYNKLAQALGKEKA
jgi:hypothetical protein